MDGILAFIGAVRAVRAHERWSALLFEGILGIAAAGITWLWPHITVLVLVWVIAAWAIVTGIFEIVAAAPTTKAHSRRMASSVMNQKCIEYFRRPARTWVWPSDALPNHST
jgi:uncharacterized membrane protein HdeD (DUF308 family)